MNVTDYLVYRVIPEEKAKDVHVGEVVPIPIERDVFNGGDRKSETEDMFEIVRKREAPAFLSRKSCLFVLPYDEEKALGWIKDHHPHEDFDYALLTLRLNGDLFWCDEDIFTRAGIMPFLRNQLSLEYWEKAGDTYESFETPEGLFSGVAIVEDIVIRHYHSEH